MRCPGSVRLIEIVTRDTPAESSSFAQEGTFAHAIGAHILNGFDPPKPDIEFAYQDHDKDIVGMVTDEMLEHVMVYVEHVRKHAREGALTVERHVDLSSFVRDGMWGTSDAIVSKATELVVIDFKYGYYPVHIIDLDLLLDDGVGEIGHVNSQLLYYAAGAAHEHDWRHELITLEIVQPRCMEVPTIQSTTVTREQLKKWATEDLYRAAHEATMENAPLHAGDHCRFCPALPTCPEARRAVQELAASDFADVEVKSPDTPDTILELTNILRWAPIIEAWLKAVESQALQLMQRGVAIPGFKLVEKRANRRWPAHLTHKEIFDKLKAAGGTGQFKHFIETDFISPAKAQKIAGENAVNAVCEHPRGDLTVAPESSKKPAAKLAPLGDDFEEFQKNDT